jgi:hypothetical protein
VAHHGADERIPRGCLTQISNATKDFRHCDDAFGRTRSSEPITNVGFRGAAWLNPTSAFSLPSVIRFPRSIPFKAIPARFTRFFRDYTAYKPMESVAGV